MRDLARLSENRGCLLGHIGMHVHLQRRGVTNDQHRVAELLERSDEASRYQPGAGDGEVRAEAIRTRVMLGMADARRRVVVELRRIVTAQTSLPATYQLYLPEIWANDAERRRKVGVPEEVRFQTKPEIALAQIRSLVNEDVPRGVVLADAAYGNDNGFREGLETLGFEYVVGIQSSTSVWPPGIAPLPPQA